jgi:hypothetical protein
MPKSGCRAIRSYARPNALSESADRSLFASSETAPESASSWPPLVDCGSSHYGEHQATLLNTPPTWTATSLNRSTRALGHLLTAPRLQVRSSSNSKFLDEATTESYGARRRFNAKSKLERPGNSVTRSNFDLDWRLRTCDDPATLQRWPDIGGRLGRRATTGPPQWSRGMTSRFDCSEFPWKCRR